MAEERVQRRLATIVAADVVGYSRLMGEDKTETLAQRQFKSKVSLIEKTDQQRGAALEVVLWGLGLIAIIAGSFATQNRTEIKPAFSVASENTTNMVNRQ